MHRLKAEHLEEIPMRCSWSIRGPLACALYRRRYLISNNQLLRVHIMSKRRHSNTDEASYMGSREGVSRGGLGLHSSNKD